MKAIGGPDFFEEQTVTCHRIVNASAGENETVVATERGDHDRSCHAHRTRLTEDCVHHCHSDSIVRCVLDFRKGQHSDVGKIGQHIENDDDAAAHDQCAHKIFPGSRTSLPINVTFVQAVCAKSGPTIDFPNSSASASPPTNVKPGCAICGLQLLAHEFHQSDFSAAELAFQPRNKPITTTAASAAVFTNVNVF